MKVPSTTTLSFPTLSPLLTAGKNIVGYFLDSPRITVVTKSIIIEQLFFVFVFFCERPRSRSSGRTAALGLIVEPCDEDD
jgi:hypothetical protein